MNYFDRRGQQVTDDDARALADALERALPDVPDHDAIAHKVLSVIDTPGLGVPPQLRMLNPRARLNPFEYFSGTNKARLRRFIAFCRAGGFRIV